MTKRKSSIKEDYIQNSSVLHPTTLSAGTYEKAKALVKRLCDEGKLAYPEIGVDEKGAPFKPWSQEDGSVYDCYVDMLGLR